MDFLHAPVVGAEVEGRLLGCAADFRVQIDVAVQSILQLVAAVDVVRLQVLHGVRRIDGRQGVNGLEGAVGLVAHIDDALLSHRLVEFAEARVQLLHRLVDLGHVGAIGLLLVGGSSGRRLATGKSAEGQSRAKGHSQNPRDGTFPHDFSRLRCLEAPVACSGSLVERGFGFSFAMIAVRTPGPVPPSRYRNNYVAATLL